MLLRAHKRFTQPMSSDTSLVDCLSSYNSVNIFLKGTLQNHLLRIRSAANLQLSTLICFFFSQHTLCFYFFFSIAFSFF